MILRLLLLGLIYAGSFDDFLSYEELDNALEIFGAVVAGTTVEGRNVRVFEQKRTGKLPEVTSMFEISAIWLLRDFEKEDDNMMTMLLYKSLKI